MINYVTLNPMEAFNHFANSSAFDTSFLILMLLLLAGMFGTLVYGAFKHDVEKRKVRMPIHFEDYRAASDHEEDQWAENEPNQL